MAAASLVSSHGPGLPRAAWASIGAAIALHAALLLGRMEAQQQPARASEPVHARLVAQVRPQGAPATPVPEAAPGVLALAPAVPVAALSRREGQPQADAPRSEPATQASTLPPPDGDMAADNKPTVAAPASPDDAQADAEDVYLPRGSLTVAPMPTATPQLFYPPDYSGHGLFRAVMALFIDENGVVRRTRIEGDELPPELQAAALQVFQNTRFRPGELRGAAVKSFIRVEVIFENQAPDSANAGLPHGAS